MNVKIQDIQNLWGTTKTVIGRKFLNLNTYIRSQEMPQINNLSSQLKKLEKDKINPKQVENRKYYKGRNR